MFKKKYFGVDWTFYLGFPLRFIEKEAVDVSMTQFSLHAPSALVGFKFVLQKTRRRLVKLAIENAIKRKILRSIKSFVAELANEFAFDG